MSEARRFPPSPKRLREARRRGEVAQSPWVSIAMATLVAAFAIAGFGPAVLAASRASFERSFEAIARGTEAPKHVLVAAVVPMAIAVAPLLGSLMAVGVLGSVAQTGFVFAPEAIAPRFSRLDPRARRGLTAMSLQVLEVLRSWTMAAVIAAVAASILVTEARGLAGLVTRDAGAALDAIAALVRLLLLEFGVILAGAAALDVVWQRARFVRERRMSRREVEREHAEAEGEPHAKRERERIRREHAGAGRVGR